MDQTIKDLVRGIIATDDLAKQGKGKAFNNLAKKKARELRRQLAALMTEDHIFVDGWHIERQYHKDYTVAAFYTQASWEKYQNYKTNTGALDWIH